MNREEIYAQLEAQIPNLRRRECTPRVMEMADALLDQLLQVQHEEAFELLEDPEEVGYERA